MRPESDSIIYEGLLNAIISKAAKRYKSESAGSHCSSPGWMHVLRCTEVGDGAFDSTLKLLLDGLKLGHRKSFDFSHKQFSRRL